MTLLVLASTSPRRKALLEQIGVKVDCVIKAKVDETPLFKEKPKDLSIRLAKTKLRFVDGYEDSIVIAADTVVALGRRVLEKPADKDQAISHLLLLSGRRHRVYSSVALRYKDKELLRTSVSIVGFKRLHFKELENYINIGEWQGKAGGYAIQGYASRFIKFINGSYTNIIGLPLFETSQLLKSIGYG